MKFKYILTLGVVAAMTVSCSDDKDSLVGEGHIMIKPSISVEALVQESRAISADEDAYLRESLELYIFNNEGAIRSYKGLDNVPTDPIALLSGDYKIMAWAGDSASADYEKKFYKGETAFSVTKGTTSQVDVECTIANVVVSLKFDDSVLDKIKDTKIDVGHTYGRLDLDSDHERIYFMMPDADQDITWNFETTNAETGALVQRNGTITNALPGHEYVITLTYEAEPDEPIGGGWLNIIIDDTMIQESGEVKVSMAPQFKGFNLDNSSFDLDETQFAAPGEMKDKYIQITTSGRFKNVYVYCDQFANIFTDQRKSIDVINLEESASTKLKNAGIDPGIAVYYGDQDASTTRIIFTEAFFDTYCSTEGEYTIKFEASTEDPNDSSQILSSTKTLTLNISNDPISIENVNTELIDFSHKQAFLEGSVINDFDTTKGVTFKYRKLGNSDWLSADASVTTSTDSEGKLSGTFSALVTGLFAGTDYEFCATVTRTDGTEFTTKTKTFTTEPATQLPNSGFEYWDTSSTPYLLYASGQEMYWDSGNHGSKLAGVNLTMPDSDVKHSGTYSARLRSQKASVFGIGKFAAGNVFIGEYLKTDGTDGVLGWGRPFTGRPSKLKGYIKYTPATVSYTSSDCPEIVEGELDKGIIYMALMDDNIMEPSNYPDYPVIVRTKSSGRQLFDSSSSNTHIIAYGEIVYEEATTGEGLIEFELTLNYRRTDIRPSYIICTAAASKGGDYFAGAEGSTMWLDDLELIYE